MDQEFCFGNVKSAMPEDIQAEMSSRQQSRRGVEM